MPLTTATITASQNPQHPLFHVSLGQVLATILLGLQAYAIESKDPHALLNPTNTASLFAGILSIWTVQPAPAGN